MVILHINSRLAREMDVTLTSDVAGGSSSGYQVCGRAWRWFAPRHRTSLPRLTMAAKKGRKIQEFWQV